MSLVSCKRALTAFRQENTECKVVVMPDFFIDRIINLSYTVEAFADLMLKVAKRQGGSLDGISQTELRGGNAINVASALTSLGAKVTPIVCTSKHGLGQIKQAFKNKPIDISHIKTCNKPSMTTALEFLSQSGKTNVMLRDLGDLADFGPKNLEESEYEIIKNADYTCLFNWAGTVRFGTVLAKAIFKRAKNGKGKTYLDTADPLPNAKAIPDLIGQILETDLVDILSVNENEAITYAGFLDENLQSRREELGQSELALEAARLLARHLDARIDLHTALFSATLKGNNEVVVPTFRINVLRATGAGDAWDAGNIIGDHHGLSDGCRLVLANAVSACYLQNQNGLHPTKDEVISFINTHVLMLNSFK